MSLLGLILPITIDNIAISSLSYDLAVESVYTVYTQFGIFIFSPIIINFISDDYKEKTIYFYHKLGYSPLSYYLTKVISLVILLIITTLSSSLLLSLIFANYSILLAVFLKLLAVSSLFAILSSLFAFIFNSFVKAFIANFIFWLIGNLLSAGGGFLEFFSYYDAANTNYKNFIDFLSDKGINIFSLLAKDYLYDFFILIISLILVFAFRKVWKKNGI